MRTILLDTHIFLWMHHEPEKLSAKVRTLLKDKEVRWSISQISVWEIQVKYDTGKLSLPAPPGACIPDLIHQSGLAYQVLQDNAVFMLGKLPMLHRDPFDRLLIATCIVNGWTLATQDEQIHKYSVLTLT